MKKWFALLLCSSMFLCSFSATAQQTTNERVHQIRKIQFPTKAKRFLEEHIIDARKMKFYKEIENSKSTYQARFKKDRLRYSIDFNTDEDFKSIQFGIKEIDIPEDSFKQISQYLAQEFTSFLIRKMHQQYPILNNTVEKTLKTAFQNLILPSMHYSLIINGKKDTAKVQYEMLFDANGKLISKKISLPTNHDRVLY